MTDNLLALETIRDRCGQIFQSGIAGHLTHFAIDLDQLPATVNYVLEVIRSNYPDLQVPFHSRWRHFGPGLLELQQSLAGLSELDQARAKFDLAITSVLLDAGAGPDWRYVQNNRVWQRSEGLAVASLQMFRDGLFSSDPHQPLQADALGLQGVTLEALARGLQVSDTNPIVGLPGRLALIHGLGRMITERSQYFPVPRLGGLVDYLIPQAESPANQTQPCLRAAGVFAAVINGLGGIWPGLGDVWPHAGKLVPFHKLCQWLTYSLLEPLQDLGLSIVGLGEMTGLPEYRNGGLCLDLGLLRPKYPELLTKLHLPGDEAIVEWRALTVILLDQIAGGIQQELDQPDFPLVKVLEGGTWAAGRKIARILRPQGEPPIKIISDGTVF